MFCTRINFPLCAKPRITQTELIDFHETNSRNDLNLVALIQIPNNYYLSKAKEVGANAFRLNLSSQRSIVRSKFSTLKINIIAGT